LGRFKNIEIEGLLTEDFGEMFVDGLNKAIKSAFLKKKL
jgi:hypothetical protein